MGAISPRGQQTLHTTVLDNVYSLSSARRMKIVHVLTRHEAARYRLETARYIRRENNDILITRLGEVFADQLVPKRLTRYVQYIGWNFVNAHAHAMPRNAQH